jgi:hypothetical protein
MGKSNQNMLRGQHRLRRIEIDPAIGGQRADIDVISGKLPGHDIAVMLQLAEQDARPFFPIGTA